MTDEDDEDAVIIPPKLRSNSSPLPTVQDLPSSPDPAAAKVAIPSSRPDPSSHLAHENDLENDQQRPTKNTRSKSAKNQISKTRFTWISLVRICTCCLPNKLLLYLFKGNKQVATAFREKLVLNFAILLVSFAFFFLVIGLQWLVCPQANQVLSEYELQSLSSDSYPLVSIYGNYYLIKDVYTDHVKNAAYLSAGAFAATVLGQDVSPMFLKTPSFTTLCPGLPAPPDGWDNIKRVIPEKAMTVWTIHDGKDNKGVPKNYLKMIDHDRKGAMARDKSWIQQRLLADPISVYLIVAYGRVYDVSQYMVSISGDSPVFLGPNILQIISAAGKTGQDLSGALDQVRGKEGKAKWKQYLNCMDSLFFVGVVDQRGSVGCMVSSYIVLVASLLIVTIIGVKFLAALQVQPRPSPTPPRRFVLVSVPCYNEGAESLLNTFSSVAATSYENGMKLLFVVVDGVVKGRENDQFTSDIVLQVLQHPSATKQEGNNKTSSFSASHPEEGVGDPDDSSSRYSTMPSSASRRPRNTAPFLSSPTRMYHSLGEASAQLNMARVYSGYFEGMPYIVVVKTGELANNGNRGKRDSQLVVLSFLSRLHRDEHLSPLDLEIQYHLIYALGMDGRVFEFLLWVDGDTLLDKDSLALFVSNMENDSGISGICGETVLRNPSESWVTMIQVYEYWITHNLAKSFESMFGSVTCLPGCFSLYRLFTSEGALIVISQRVVQEFGLRKVDTLHLKNLLSLGEDRYLTTLCLKTFPQMKTKFISSAIAKTSAPDLWKVLLSQRRRWINSTVHNLLELCILPNLKGFFLFSIRFIVIMDLVSTILSPAGFIYFVYLLVVLFSQVVIQIPLVSILLLCSIYGLQILLFLFKRQFAHIGWMLLYLLAMPLFTFILPLYSFWKMDDFSWGSTRLVQEEEVDDDDDDVFSPSAPVHSPKDEFDASCIPLKKWSEYEAENLPLRLAKDLPHVG